MYRLLIVVAAAAFTLGGIAPAVAAPDNKNTSTIPVDCDPPIGSVDVTVTHGSGATGFLPDGRVVVVKRVGGDFSLFIDDGSGPVLLASDSFEQDLGAKGQGHAGKLVECTFVESESFSDVLTAQTAAELIAEFDLEPDALDAYIGEEVEITFQFEGTVLVKLPGNR